MRPYYSSEDLLQRLKRAGYSLENGDNSLGDINSGKDLKALHEKEKVIHNLIREFPVPKSLNDLVIFIKFIRPKAYPESLRKADCFCNDFRVKYKECMEYARRQYGNDLRVKKLMQEDAAIQKDLRSKIKPQTISMLLTILVLMCIALLIYLLRDFL